MAGPLDRREKRGHGLGGTKALRLNETITALSLDPDLPMAITTATTTERGAERDRAKLVSKARRDEGKMSVA